MAITVSRRRAPINIFINRLLTNLLSNLEKINAWIILDLFYGFLIILDLFYGFFEQKLANLSNLAASFCCLLHLDFWIRLCLVFSKHDCNCHIWSILNSSYHTRIGMFERCDSQVDLSISLLSLSSRQVSINICVCSFWTSGMTFCLDWFPPLCLEYDFLYWLCGH